MTFRGTFKALYGCIFSKNDKFDSLNRSVTASPPNVMRQFDPITGKGAF